jgi:SAM-dependent methyltransferase
MTTPDERWLAATWPLVRAHLPPAPARVMDVGCGRLGGFVPMLRSDGYDAVGIDPHAPNEPHYERIEFERAVIPHRVDVAIASFALHHVASPAKVLDRIISTLTSDGAVVVVEWAWEKFDESTAAWCFERLGPGGHSSWLYRRREEWLASGHDWANYMREWAEREGLHAGGVLVRLLDERLDRELLELGPYFFPDLVETPEAEEQSAIDAGRIRACRIDYVGTRR